jgi:PAS domain S-box-containing protein
MIIYNQYKKVQSLNTYTARQYESIQQTRTIIVDLTDMETGVRGFVITGDNRFLAPYTAADGRVRNEIITLRYATYWEDKSFAETNDWLDRVEVIQKMLSAQVAAVRQHGRNTSLPTVELEKQRAATASLRDALEATVVRRTQALNEHLKDTESQKSNFVFILALGSSLGIGILLIGTIVILRQEADKERFVDETEKAEARFRRVMDGINDGLYELNFVNETLYASKEFKAMLGYEAHELEDTVDMATGLIHPDDLAQALEVRRQYIMKQTPRYINIFRMKHKDGTWRWVMSRGVGTWDRFGQIRSIIGTHTDITEQKTREEEFKQLHADMEAFTYITSHDMRAPLVNLKGFSHELALAVKELSTLLGKGKLAIKDRERINIVLNTDIPEALGFIGNAVDRMDTLTTAILDLSRIGKYVYRDELVDAQAVFDKCLGAQSYEIAEKKVEVVTEPLPALVTDPVALEQILGNLLDNAIKFLRPDQPGRIEVACHETGRDYIFSIRDNGRGIESEDRARVFHIFRRARNTGNVRGLGLGMAFVKATLRKLGGSIWFDSTVDVGTTFYVSLPKKAAAAGADSKIQMVATTVQDMDAANANLPRIMAGSGAG